MQQLIADRLIERCSDLVEDVLTAPTRRLADQAVQTFPTLVVLRPVFSGSQPDQQFHILVTGTARIDVLAYTRSDEDQLDPDEADEILDAATEALVQWAPVIYEDESPLPLYLEDRRFEDSEGAQIRAIASFAMEVVQTHTEG